MARRMKLANAEFGGHIEVLAIQETDGQWEHAWEPLRGTEFGALFSVVSKETLDHSLNGWSKPLTEALGLSPAGALVKLPKDARECYRRAKCPLYNGYWCHLPSEKLPWCFEPAGEMESQAVRDTAAKAVEQWREGVYLLVVTDGPPA